MSKKSAEKIATTKIKTAAKTAIKPKNFTVKIDNKKDDKLSNFGKAVLKDRY